MKYYIGTTGFNSKNDCSKYVTSKIKNLGECEIKNNNINFVFFDNLLVFIIFRYYLKNSIL